jgi:ribosomal protein S18 acetylase RimI-like enzyme
MLMRALEVRARSRGFTLLTLDAVRGGAAARLYRQAGWTRVGIIPKYALFPEGSACDTVIFYKDLLPTADPPLAKKGARRAVRGA